MTENRVELMRALFPDLADRVDAAYEAFAGERPEAAFDDWVDARAAEVLPSAARLSVEDAAVAERFDRAFASAHIVAELLGVPAPEIEAFLTVRPMRISSRKRSSTKMDESAADPVVSTTAASPGKVSV